LTSACRKIFTSPTRKHPQRVGRLGQFSDIAVVSNKGKQIVIIGGGAAGYFAAIACAEAAPQHKVIILEKANKVLQKVRISGGGRCNVTHACFEPKELVKFYPRGSKALIGPFHQFQPGDTMGWFADRGVELKIEKDNRVFPVSDDSRSIMDALTNAARDANVEVRLQQQVNNLVPPNEHQPKWEVQLADQTILADAVMVAAGSSKQMWKILRTLGHRIVEPVPSLFTFNIKDPRIDGLMGLAAPADVKVADTKLEAHGPLLITHWGMSGPGILRLSAWGAPELANRQYQFKIIVSWVDGYTTDSLFEEFKSYRNSRPKQAPAAHSEFGLPNRLWRRLVDTAGIGPQTKWADLSNKHMLQLSTELTAGRYPVNGKSTFKDEFVTCGGVHLDEVNFKTMESKIHPGLHFAGEILNVDAITGGFNFQAAWTCGWISGNHLAES
jgi:predicted Rossmann fold flavoprotein